MSERRLETLAGQFRLDFLGYLGPDNPAVGRGQFVISAEFKASKKAIEAEILVTGFVRDPENQSEFQTYLLPLLSFELPVWPREGSSERFTDYASKLNESAFMAEKELEQLFRPLYELAMASQRAGGLRAVRIGTSELGNDRKGPRESDIRGLRQDRRFEIARAHLQAHQAVQEQLVAGTSLKVGRQASITIEELRFANLYSLARAIGVKEIAPRILSDDVREVGFQQKIDPTSEFTVLVARLKRAGVIPE
ncbi:MAG: hypothetical protein F2536_02370 [Actinobacteria bacterium]|uniref:Unannotated protein n=1 Tax=freshwater metagenome TaxID=449393 RepID=A0A6J6BY08_9ZZZZ|nr:hypothetical protein [Actinomycetota bacterium]